MIELIIILLCLVAIGFMWGGFISLLIAIISIIVGYFIGVYGSLTIVLLAAIGSGIQKFRNK